MTALQTYLFVHIPKTAGTSFRLAVERAFDHRVLYDYGPETLATSERVREHVYDQPDLPALEALLAEERIVLFGGHVPYERYASIFPPERVITFLREPVARVVSQHRHACRLDGYQGGVLEFSAAPGHRNMQTAMLRGLALDDAALVGITERYGPSLTLGAERLGWEVPELTANQDPERAELTGPPAVTAAEEAELREHNRLDLELYQAALDRLDRQLAATERGRPATKPGDRSRPRGVLGRYQEGKVIGWAQYVGNDEPVRVRIEVDRSVPVTVLADRWRADLRAKGLHKTGRAGFEAEVGTLRPGSQVRCFVGETDQELTGSPLTVP